MVWEQIYDPTNFLWFNTLLAGLPILLLLGLLASGRVKAHVAAIIGLTSALVVAIFCYVPKMGEAGYLERVATWMPTMLAAAGNGALVGLLPIGWIVFNAIFLYALTVETGQFEIVKHSVAALSGDRRLQALLIAFCFGAFIEGAAGFGTPVAISAALMMGAGFRPLQAAGLALLANTSPVAFGALGTPIRVLGEVTDLPPMLLSMMAGRQLPFFSLLIPVWLVWVMSGWRGVVGVWPALLVCGGSFALVQFLVSNFHGRYLVDVAGGLISMVSLALFLRLWQPREIWRFPEEKTAADASETPHYTIGQIAYAWSPWVFLSVFVFLWGLGDVKAFLDSPLTLGRPSQSAQPEPHPETNSRVQVRPTIVSFDFPFVHNKVRRVPPIVPGHDREAAEAAVQLTAHFMGPQLTNSSSGPLAGVSHVVVYSNVTDSAIDKAQERIREEHTEGATYKLNWLSTTGTSIFLAALLSALWLGIGVRQFVRIFSRTLFHVRWALVTIVCMLAIAWVTRYSGMDASLGLVFQLTGPLYPFFAALLGWLGVALTGSDTSSNALFGSLQTLTASNLARAGTLPLTEMQAKVLMATANSTGGVMGKMIDAQSIVVASAATGQTGQEGAILRFVFWHSIVLAFLMGLLVLFQAYFWQSCIPVPR
ncbi:MAG: L-lactate permease [Gemmataceae bacterium]